MTLVEIIAVAAIVVPALTAVLNAYWNRKQLRQIEAYKQDPSVGLIPPPSALRRLVTSRWRVLLMAGLPALSIALQLWLKVPVTLWTVVLISVNVASIVAAFLLELLEKVSDVIGHMVALQEDMVRSERDHLRITGKVVDTVFPKEPPRPGA